MDFILGKVTQQAMNYAIRSGVTLTASYAIKQSTKLLQNAPKSNVRDELMDLQHRLQHKIKIVSPAIDLIELIAARGNTSLESAVSLTKELRLDIEHLGQRLAKAAASNEEYKSGSSRNKANLRDENEQEMQLIIHEIKQLLSRIEDAVPLISLALTTSGAKLSTQLPSTVSPSRLLQASTFLTTGDTQYSMSPHHVAQIGPTFNLSVYMLFAGYDRPETEEDVRNTTWKEVIHKARVKLRRVPLDVLLTTGSGSDALPSEKISSHGISTAQEDSPSQVRGEKRADEFAYQLMVVEDFDDDRYHDFNDSEKKPDRFDDIVKAGIREMIPVHEISKIFYADTSKVLNIGTDAESNHPVLLLRRDVHAVPPRRMLHQEAPEQSDDEAEIQHSDNGKPKTKEDQKYVEEDHADRDNDPWRLPASLDPEWIAFEVYTEAPIPDDESDIVEDDGQDFQTPEEGNETKELTSSLSAMQLGTPLAMSAASQQQDQTPQPGLPQIKTSLSMLELLLRLTSLQQFQQQSHLAITDELLNFFLEESSSTGAGGNEQHRQAMRADARRRVGWDPYNESPVKRRGEDYQYNQQQYYDSPRTESQYQQSYAGSPGQPQDSPAASPYAARYGDYDQKENRGPSQQLKSPPTTFQAQTRSITGTPESKHDDSSSSPYTTSKRSIMIGNRPDWLKLHGNSGSRGSPLRPQTGRSDEGIGTSPASNLEDESMTK